MKTAVQVTMLGVIFAIMSVVVPAVRAQSVPVAGSWVMAITVSGDNAKDRARIPQGATLTCAQAGPDVICQTAHGDLLSGTVDGDAVTLHMTLTVVTGTNGIGFCWWICLGSSGPRTFDVAMTFRGTVTDIAMAGAWTGEIVVGAGRYPVKGTWKAIHTETTDVTQTQQP